MIKRLRRTFVLVAMVSVALVLTGIMVTINVTNYLQIISMADERLALLAEGGGTFPTRELPTGTQGAGAQDGASAQAPAGSAAAPPEGLSPEAPFETRFFTVTLVADGTVSAADTEQIAAVSQADAESWAQSLFHEGRMSGFIGSYRFLAVSGEQAGGSADSGTTMYIFVDCSRDLGNFWSFLTTSVGVSALGLGLVLALSLILSRVAVKPIVTGYERQKRFITDASHEIKTPLSVIDAAVEVIEIEHGEDEWSRSIHDQVARLAALTGRLVTLARIDEGGVLEMGMVGISALTERSVSTFQAVAETRGQQLTADIAAGFTCRGDATALAQVLELLLDNATRYTPEGGVISVMLRARGHGVELTVANTCDTLPNGDLDRLFERFYRPDASRSAETGGSGIGLSVVRSVAEAHGGTATVERRGEHEIAFIVRLP